MRFLKRYGQLERIDLRGVDMEEVATAAGREYARREILARSADFCATSSRISSSTAAEGTLLIGLLSHRSYLTLWDYPVFEREEYNSRDATDIISWRLATSRALRTSCFILPRFPPSMLRIVQPI